MNFSTLGRRVLKFFHFSLLHNAFLNKTKWLPNGYPFKSLAPQGVTGRGKMSASTGMSTRRRAANAANARAAGVRTVCRKCADGDMILSISGKFATFRQALQNAGIAPPLGERAGTGAEEPESGGGTEPEDGNFRKESNVI